MLPVLSQVTSAVRLKLSPGMPAPGGPGAPSLPPGACGAAAAGGGGIGAAEPPAGVARSGTCPAEAPVGAVGAEADAAAGPAPRPSPPPEPPRPAPPPTGRTEIASGLRLNTSCSRPSGSNFITLLDP